jgi:hypothetical protein
MMIFMFRITMSMNIWRTSEHEICFKILKPWDLSTDINLIQIGLNECVCIEVQFNKKCTPFHSYALIYFFLLFNCSQMMVDHKWITG